MLPFVVSLPPCLGLKNEMDVGNSRGKSFSSILGVGLGSCCLSVAMCVYCGARSLQPAKLGGLVFSSPAIDKKIKARGRGERNERSGTNATITAAVFFLRSFLGVGGTSTTVNYYYILL